MYARSKTPSMGTPSVYSIHASHLTLRSSNLRSTRSMKSLRTPWYQRPILKDAIFIDTQRGALVIAFYSLVTFRIHLQEPGPRVALLSFTRFTVFKRIHAGHFCIRHLLPGHGPSRFHTLRLLCYELPVCVRRKCLG